MYTSIYVSIEQDWHKKNYTRHQKNRELSRAKDLSALLYLI